jgi:hypothetical protein
MKIEEKFASLVNMLYADNTHYHKCGYPGPARRKDEDPSPDVKGCGYEWAHWKATGTDPNTADYRARHMCPVCGAGPWWVMPPMGALDPPRELPQDGDLGMDGIALFAVGFDAEAPKEVNDDEDDFLQLLRQLSR